MGRFLSPDPFPSQRRNPGSLHRYVYVENEPVNARDPLGLFSYLALEPIWNGFKYLRGEGCPQFGRCLVFVSAIVIPAALRLLSLAASPAASQAVDLFAVPDAALTYVELWATARWLHAQNRCMFNRWEAQDSTLWKLSQTTCNSRGWTTNGCCRARIIGEQDGFDRCAAQTRGLAQLSPHASFLVKTPRRSRVEFKQQLCGCDG